MANCLAELSCVPISCGQPRLRLSDSTREAGPGEREKANLRELHDAQLHLVARALERRQLAAQRGHLGLRGSAGGCSRAGGARCLLESL
jgi:hypothetical protein